MDLKDKYNLLLKKLTRMKSQLRSFTAKQNSMIESSMQTESTKYDSIEIQCDDIEKDHKEIPTEENNDLHKILSFKR